MKIRTKIEGLLEHLNAGVYEKQEVIGLALLATLAGGKGIFMLGPVGIAKSLVAARIKFIFPNAKHFEYLMTKYSTPDEIFGNISVSKLKNDIYERQVDGFLPTADVAFLDEIFKGSSSIQNSLLRIVNEKLYRNGSKDIKVPMKALIAASNELPEKGQEAIWDRLLIRYLDGNIKERDNFEQMIVDDNDLSKDCVPAKFKISFPEYDQIVKEIGSVTVPQNILNLIQIIRGMIHVRNQAEPPEKQVYVSDRRWKNIMRILKASAFLNDRGEVNLSDCFLMSHCLWNEPDQFVTISELIAEAISKHGYFNKNAAKLSKAKDDLQQLMEGLTQSGIQPSLLDKFDMELGKAQTASGLTNFVKTQKAAIEKAADAEMKTDNIFIVDDSKYDIVRSCFDNATIELEQLEIDILTLNEN